MKKEVTLVLVLCLILGMGLAACAEATGGNYTDEMKISYAVDLSEADGADSVEREGDHADSPYFSRVDFYNATSADTLTILPHFRTQQQTSEWSCGVSCALMVLDHFDRLGDHNEQTLSMLRGEQKTGGKSGDTPSSTSLLQLIDIFNAVGGFELTSTFDLESPDDFTLDTIQDYLKQGLPIVVGWNDWGGHWQVIIGYDTMGTQTQADDVLIVADPYDTTDHNQDGYGVVPAERFIYNFTFYNFFNDEDLNDKCFLVAKPVAQ